MKARKLFLTLAVGVASVAISGAADTKNIEQAIRDLDEQFSKAAAAKDVDKLVSFYSDDAIALPPNAEPLTTKDAIRSQWKEMISDPNVTITWNVSRVEVAKSGDMAYSSGTYEVTMNSPSGKSVAERGKYLEVWEKQADGKWKCGADMWSSNAPAAPEKK